MPFDDYLALPGEVRAEYVDGQAVVSPPPTAGHQRVARRVATAIEAGAPGLFVVDASGVWTGERRGRIPDVLVTTTPYDAPWAVETPVLVVEVLSPSTRREDLVRKSTEYRESGIGQYWIVDRDHRTLDVLANEQAGWTPLLELDERSPRGTVAIGEHGHVDLDLTALLAP